MRSRDAGNRTEYAFDPWFPVQENARSYAVVSLQKFIKPIYPILLSKAYLLKFVSIISVIFAVNGLVQLSTGTLGRTLPQASWHPVPIRVPHMASLQWSLAPFPLVYLLCPLSSAMCPHINLYLTLEDDRCAGFIPSAFLKRRHQSKE